MILQQIGFEHYTNLQLLLTSLAEDNVIGRRAAKSIVKSEEGTPEQAAVMHVVH